jgi:putative membrane protein
MRSYRKSVVTTARSENPETPITELRLHPLSWLFELLNVIKQFIIPIIILLFTGKSNNYELWGLVGVGIMVPLAVARYITFRYHIGNNRIVIRSGLLHKTVRDIAFTRIQNVTLNQGLLHRFMHVAEVRLETGGGEKEEGRMRVLGFAQAQELQRIIRSQDISAVKVSVDDKECESNQILLKLPTLELLKLGLISNKGMILVAAAMGASWQFDFLRPDKLITNVGSWLFDHRNDIVGGGPASYVLGILLLLLFAFMLLRLISIIQAFLHYHGFILSGDNNRLSIERGLLNKFHGSLPRTRIQAWTLQQGWLQRKFNRFALRVDAAAGGVKSENMESQWQLAPIADEQHIENIIDSVIPQGSWPIAIWQPLHPNAWKRKYKTPAILLILPTLIAAYWAWQLALLMLLAHPWLWFTSKLLAKNACYSFDFGLIAVREGWISKTWRFAEVRKVQAVYLKQSPFDRRHGMATVFMDTVNAGSFEPPLAVRYLPYDEAVTLHKEITKLIAQ